MTRKEFLHLAAVSLLPAASAKRPNFIFILIDDMGYGDVHRHGNAVVKTPHLDRLHDESVRFTDFHVSPTCAPTRSSLLSGKHEFKNGVTHTINERERMSLKTVTIAQVLQTAGYATGIFGKWHLGDAAEYQPNRRGFDEMYIHGCGGIGQRYPGTCSDAPGNQYTNPTLMHNGKFEKTEGYCTDLFFNQALRWVDGRRKSGKPFFAYIPTNSPHAPLQCPENYRKMYDGATHEGRPLTENEKKYFGMVTNIDDNVGALLAKVKEWGLERDTLVIFMTDNGGTGGVKVFNAGMRGSKGTPYQGGTRVPAYFRWTGTYKPAEVKPLTAHLDMYPTWAELAGAKIPAGVKLDGRSLVPLLKNPAAAWPDRYIFTHVGRWEKGKAAEAKFMRCSVRNARYSMVNTKGTPEGWELYDLTADPGEKDNVAAGHPDEVKKIAAAYDKWWEEALLGMENENAVPPAVPPYVELYQKQFGG